MHRLVLVLCLSMLVLVSPAIAQKSATDVQVDLGNAALRAGDYATALSIYEPLAEAGNARAQANLGSMFERGTGVQQAHENAVYWLTKSADQGQPFGALRLGVHYDLGQGVAVNRAKALYYFEMAAHGGMGNAAFYAGTMHANGEGTTADLKQARAFFQMGAELGDKNAANAYGYYFEGGFGGTVDLREAMRWYDVAIAQGDEMATRNKSKIVSAIVARGDDHVAAGDFDKARKSFDFACLNGLSDGCYRLAELHYSGKGGPVDKLGSMSLIEQACDLGITDACASFGDLVIELGQGPPESSKAVNRLDALCTGGRADQCHNLAYLLLHDSYRVYDYQRGKSALQKACSDGYTTSCAPYNDLVFNEGTAAGSSSGSGVAGDVLDFMTDFALGLASANYRGGFSSTTCTGCGTYSSSFGATDSFASTNQAQDSRNFDVFIQSHSSYGGSCPASNPYC